MKSGFLLGLLLLVGGLLVGCAYAPVNLYRGDIGSVYVDFFDNLTFRRGLEVYLTRAVVDEVTQQTPLVLASRETADSILSGQLVELDERTHIKSEDDEILLKRVSARIRFRWRDRLTNRDIVLPRDFTESARVTEEVDERRFELLFRKAAQTIVEEMQGNW